MRTRLASIVLLGLLLLAGHAQALTLGSSTSTEGIGGYVGYLWYVPASNSEAHLWVTLTNTTPRELGGYITGFTLNNPRNQITKVQAVALPKGFALLGGQPFDAVKASPFGFFDFGAALGGNFLGGGSPVLGIPAVDGEDTAEFEFKLTGKGLLDLTEDDFMYELSRPQGGAGQQGFFAVRFKGFLNGGSDKVMAASFWQED